MLATRMLAVAAWCFVCARADDESDSLLSVFFGNTGLGRWWMDPEYEILADAQIDSLNALEDVDALCLTEINVEKLMTRYEVGLQDVYPYSYFPPSERRGDSEYQCNCSTALYEEAYDCLSNLTMAGETDYSPCFGVTKPPNHCWLCWTAYFDESVGVESIAQCNGGNYTQPAGKPDDSGRCVYGDGTTMNVALFSKYPITDPNSRIFEAQSFMFNGVVDADIVKNDVSYHVFCTAFANYRHLEVMKSQAAELSEYMNDVRGLSDELESGDTVVLLLGDFNAGEQGECVECVDYPENDNGTVWNTILDIDEAMYSIYENNFNDDGETVPRCTSCVDNPRNDDDPDYVEYIGENAFGFVGDEFESTSRYMAQRGWLETVESLNTSLTDKYAILIYGSMESNDSMASSSSEEEEEGDGAARICISLVFVAVSMGVLLPN